MERWVLHAKRADFNQIASTYQISPVLARLIRNRDVISEEEIRQYLFGTFDDLPSPHLLKDVDKAAGIMKKKIEEGKKIRIISDYDVDGVSSNYILWNGLKKCGANVDFRIPDRMEDGYGINENLIIKAKTEGIDTIITCDNGIAAIQQIEYAKNLGMTVIVTDHHDIPYEENGEKQIFLLPQADAVVNPKQVDCLYPNKNICGAVVSLKFIQVLYELYGYIVEDAEGFFEMAALATVCDVMPLQGENRILVKEGLKRIQNTRIIGLKALMEANDLMGKKISGYHFGFVLGPCINASGRLETAAEAMELLICQDKNEAMKKAFSLTDLNKKRKEMTNVSTENAIAYLEESGHVKDKVLVIYLKDCHESIAGIIAGRIREHYNKPAYVLTKAKDGVKGSGRSIESYHMFKELTKVKDCLTKFGGHPMAAGLSLEEGRVEEFCRRVNENATLTEEDFIRKVQIDVAVPFYYLSEHFIEELSLLEPFGMKNEKPIFAQKDLEILSVRILGNSGRCVKLCLKDAQGFMMDAMYFGESQPFIDEMKDHYGEEIVARLQKGLPTGSHMHIIYYPQINEWNGRRNIQVVIDHYKLV